MLNALTIDLEDWAQSVVDPRLAITSRVVDNVWRLLDLLDGRGVRATFFALGRVCEQFEMLLPRIASAGHEIGSHGYGHELVYRLTPEEFAEDVGRSVGIIQAQTGIIPIGYRAPGFSITRASLWAGPVLARLGFAYDSSIFPIAGGRYGIDPRTRFSFVLQTVHGTRWDMPAEARDTRLLRRARDRQYVVSLQMFSSFRCTAYSSRSACIGSTLPARRAGR